MSNESEDAINKAQSILAETGQDTPYLVSLSTETAGYIGFLLGAETVIGPFAERVISRLGGLPNGQTFNGLDGLPLHHPERLLPQLLDKFTTTYSNRDKSKLVLIVQLNAVELDFINERVRPDRNKPDEEDEILYGALEEKTAAFMRNIDYMGTLHLSKSFIELNLAFVKAGGIPRKLFTDYYEGPLPLTELGDSESSSE